MRAKEGKDFKAFFWKSWTWNIEVYIRRWIRMEKHEEGNRKVKVRVNIPSWQMTVFPPAYNTEGNGEENGMIL